MNTTNDRRQSLETAEVEKRKITERRKLIDTVKETNDGYLYRDTKIPLQGIIAGVIGVCIGVVLFFLYSHMVADYHWSISYDNPARLANPVDMSGVLNIMEVVMYYTLTTSFTLGAMGSFAYFFIKEKNKKEFEMELHQSGEILSSITKHRSVDEEEIQKTQQKLEKMKERRRPIDEEKNAHDGYLYRDTKIPHLIMIVSIVVVVIGLAAFFMYLRMEADALWSVDIHNTARIYVRRGESAIFLSSCVKAIIQSILAISATSATISTSVYLYLKERNKKEFEEELYQSKKMLKLLENYRHDDEEK